jgi:hypothetical protein
MMASDILIFFPVRITISSEVIPPFLSISVLQLPWNLQDLYDLKTINVGYAWRQIKMTMTVAITSANGAAFAAVTWLRTSHACSNGQI